MNRPRRQANRTPHRWRRAGSGRSLRDPARASTSSSRGFEQVERANDVGLDEVACARNRTIDMAFSSKVHDAVRRKISHGSFDRLAITDVCVHEAIGRLRSTARSDPRFPA